MNVLHNQGKSREVPLAPAGTPPLRLVAIEDSPSLSGGVSDEGPKGRLTDVVLRFHREQPANRFFDLSEQRLDTMSSFRHARLTMLCESKHCLEVAVDRLIDEVMAG